MHIEPICPSHATPQCFLHQASQLMYGYVQGLQSYDK